MKESTFRVLLGRAVRLTAEGGDVKSTIADYIDWEGFEYFCYSGSSPESGLVFGHTLDTFPHEWTSRFVDMNYYECCSVVAAGRSTYLPISWSNTINARRGVGRDRQKSIDARDHGIAHGFSVPILGPGGSSISFDIACSRDARRPLLPSGKRYQRIVAFAHHLQAYGMDLLGVIGAKDSGILSEHERICLAWTLKGKTTWEIGQITGRSRDTIVYHLRKAIRKLGATNKAHAAIIALQKGLI